MLAEIAEIHQLQILKSLSFEELLQMRLVDRAHNHYVGVILRDPKYLSAEITRRLQATRLNVPPNLILESFLERNGNRISVYGNSRYEVPFEIRFGKDDLDYLGVYIKGPVKGRCRRGFRTDSGAFVWSYGGNMDVRTMQLITKLLLLRGYTMQQLRDNN